VIVVSRNEGKKHGFRPLKAIVMIILIILAALGAFSVYSSGLGGSIFGSSKNVSITQVKKIIKPASDLIVTRYKYKDIGKYENYKHLWGKKVPFTTDKELFSYEGQISVGFDVSDIEVKKIDKKNKTITIALPKIKVIANELDTKSIKMIDSTDSIFTSSDLSDYSELFDKLKETQEDEAMSDEKFLKQARKNAESCIRSLFAENDATKDYKIIFTDK
jgi:hypothetical protein